MNAKDVDGNTPLSLAVMNGHNFGFGVRDPPPHIGGGVPDPKTKVVQNFILILNPFTKLLYEPGKWVKFTKN